jgi:hypothetical protein
MRGVIIYTSPEIKLWEKRWTRHVAYMIEMKTYYETLVGEIERKKLFRN